MAIFPVQLVRTVILTNYAVSTILFMRTWIVFWLPAALGTIIACSSSPTATLTPATQVEPASPEHALFISKGCAACHGQNAEGLEIAPALAGHSEQMVKRLVRNPRFQMPAFSQEQVSDEEIKRDARIEPSTIRNIERGVEGLGIGYRVEQLS